MRSTRIVATVGPATDAPFILERMLKAGVDVFRLNASHGTWDDHARRISAIRGLSAEVGILLDLQGPKLRLGKFTGGGCVLETGSVFVITSQPVEGHKNVASTSYEGFAKIVKPGDAILLADGTVRLEAISTDGTAVACRVLEGGPIGDHKGINLPGAALGIPSLTEKDREDLEHAVAAGVDFLALSFVRSAADIALLQRHLEELHADIPVIAKIEKPEGVRNLASILDAADGVMVARGDLGVETALEKVPFIQKQIIAQAREEGKFVITATQMLESMITEATPTRAEVSDVANAICDGTDAVMLSAETSVGHNPVEAVATMARIAVEAENSLRPRGFPDPLPFRDPTHADIVADAAYHAARAASVAAIVVGTATGSTARRISRFRPPVPVFAFTREEHVARTLQLSFGVQSLVMDDVATTDEMLEVMERTLMARGLLRPGDSVVFVAGQPIGEAGSANMIKLHRLRAPVGLVQIL